MKKILVTGISGAIGSQFLEHALINTDWDIIGIASWKHKGVPERILDSKYYQENKDRVKIITHDLISPFSSLTKKEIGNIDYIVNFAAESHVDRSISEPVPFIKNNIDVVLNMLEFAREIKPQSFIQISSDESYGVAKEGQLHQEWSSIIPSNPYAASKASQEAIAISYWRTYGIPIIITNTMNNFSERQDPEKFIPICIHKVLNGEEIIIHSYPDEKRAGSRFYLHARNHADAVIFLIKNTIPAMFCNGADRPDRYNIVGEKEVDNLELAKLIHRLVCEILPEKEIPPLKYKLQNFHGSRPGHDTRYGLTGDKMYNLGWVAPMDFEESLKKTIQWSINNPKWLKI